MSEKMSDEIKGLDRNRMSPQFNPYNTHPESHIDTMNEQLLNMLKILSHDLRGSLISILATLKLLNRGYYGKMDESVKIKSEELFEKVKGLIGMTEEYLGKAFSVNEDLQIEREVLDLKEDTMIRTFSFERPLRLPQPKNSMKWHGKLYYSSCISIRANEAILFLH